MQIIERFELSSRGLVVVCDRSTDLPVRRKLKAIVVQPDGTKVSTTANKEYILRRRDGIAHEFEAFVLERLDLTDVPEGSTVDVTL